MEIPLRFLGALLIPFKQHHAGGIARAVLDRLRALDDFYLVKCLRKDIRRGWVHAVAAAAENGLAVEQDIQAGAGHAAQYRVAIGAAFADHGKAGDGFQVVGAVVGRQWLPRFFGVGHQAKGLFGFYTGHHHLFDSCAFGCFIGMRREGAHQRRQ